MSGVKKSDFSWNLLGRFILFGVGGRFHQRGRKLVQHKGLIFEKFPQHFHSFRTMQRIDLPNDPTHFPVQFILPDENFFRRAVHFSGPCGKIRIHLFRQYLVFGLQFFRQCIVFSFHFFSQCFMFRYHLTDRWIHAPEFERNIRLYCFAHFHLSADSTFDRLVDLDGIGWNVTPDVSEFTQ